MTLFKKMKPCRDVIDFIMYMGSVPYGAF